MSPSTSTSVLFLSLLNSITITSALSATLSHARQTCQSHTIEGTGTFTHQATYTFSGTSLPAGLHASPDLIRDQDYGAPYNHIFEISSVDVSGGYLNIRVPGGQDPASAPDQAISSGEVFTDASDILYASVRTTEILDTELGTCQGMFFYKTDTEEIDIEHLSDPSSRSNVDGTAEMHFTNQAADGGEKSWSHQASPSDVGGVAHEYRIDWAPEFTAFYVDGELKQKYEENIPTEAGTWLWNNWSNGDTGWSAGPPKAESVMRIKKIEMFYNTTSSTGGC